MMDVAAWTFMTMMLVHRPSHIAPIALAKDAD